MKYGFIKRTISWLYRKIRSIDVEVARNELKETIGHIGEGSEIEYPFIKSNEHRIHIGRNTTILSNSRIDVYLDYGLDGEVIIGDNCYIGYYFSLFAGDRVTIGNDVLMASNVCIDSSNHGMDAYSTVPYMHQDCSKAPVTIGDGCWIGEKVIICKGVEIGKKSIIGAGAVVTRSIPAYSVAVGNPARVIKKYDFDLKDWVRA